MRYGKIESRVWNDEKFITLTPMQQRLFLYTLTCPHGNLIGLYVLKKEYIIGDLKSLPKDLDKDLRKLCESSLIRYDFATSVIFIKNYLKHNPVTNPNQRKAARKILIDLPKSQLVRDFASAFEGLSEGLDLGLPEGFSKPETETEAVTETEAERERGPVSPQTKNTEITYPDWLDLDLWKDFKEYRQGLPKSKFTAKAEKLCLGDLSALIEIHGLEYQREIIEGTIKSCKWLTFYPPKKNGNGKSNKIDKTMEVFARRERERQEQEQTAEDGQAAGSRPDTDASDYILPS
jgi:hypothetical protein